MISVIVPIYNIERYIGICIESILKQTYQNIEVILVDDGSTDRCADICDLYAKKDDRIKVIHKKNGGLVSARKAGVRIAKGDYVGYVDGDDWIESNFYEHLMQAIEKSNADVGIAGFSRDLFHKTAHLYSNIKSGIYEKEALDFLYKNMISYGDFYSNGISTYVWNKLFRRELLKKFQLCVDERITIGEDAAVVYPLLTECKKITITENVGYHYRQREDSMLKKSKPFNEEKRGLGILNRYLCDFFSEKENSTTYINQVRDFILGICIMRSGGLSLSEGMSSLYKEDFRGKNIVIYSAGTFGQQLVNRITEYKYCNIVCWVDDDYWEYRRCCLNVDSIEDINDKEYDYVVIATIDYDLSLKINERLMGLGVAFDKILNVRCQESDRDNLLKQFLE